MLNVQEMIEKQRRAVQNKDLPTYLETITKTDPFYRKEQTYWFNDMIKDEIKSYTVEVLDVKRRDDDYIAEISQSHKIDEEWFHIQYPLLIKEEDGELRDFGYDFSIFDEDEFLVKYMSGDKRAYEIHKCIHAAYDNVLSTFGKKPYFKLEFKFYSDQELLRQRTAPTMKWLFSGWAESDESLKFFTGLENIENYQGMVQHELVHLVTLDESKKNTMQWINEGMAMRYGNGSYPLKDDLILKDIPKYRLNIPLEDLMEFDLYTADDLHEIGQYYTQVYFYFDYLDREFGVDKLFQVFKECGKVPATEDVEKRKEISEAAFEKILGVNFKDVSNGYIKWITS